MNNVSVTINMMDPLIEWTHDVTLYPSCITNYTVASGGMSITVDSGVRSLTGQQLNEAGFPYCTTLHPTVTPLTPRGPLTTVMGSSNVYTNLIDPGKYVVILVR